jgi:trimeric autotransporter adhesin
MSVIMKRILILIIGLIGVAYGQSSPTSAKTRFVNGLYVGTKLDSYFNAADSNAIYWRSDSVLRAKYKGTARTIAFVGDPASGYVPYTGAVSNVTIGDYRVSARTFLADSIMARGSGGVNVYSNSGTRVALFGGGGGAGTTLYGGLNGTSFAFSADGTVNGVGVGRGGGSILTNTLVGGLSMASNTTGEQNAVFGFEAMKFNTIGSQNSVLGYTALSNNISGGENTVVGHSSMFYNTSGAQNTSIGDGALLENRASNENTAVGYSSLYYNRAGAKNTAIGTYSGGNTLPNRNQSGSNNTYIGYSTSPSDTANTNETVIGASAIGNGSNTVTIGNSSVTNNYFKGGLNADSLKLGADMSSIQHVIEAKSATPFGLVVETTEATPTSNPILTARSSTGSVISTTLAFTNQGRLGIGLAVPVGVLDVLGPSVSSTTSQAIAQFRSGSNTFLDIIQANNATVAGQTITGSTIASTDAIAFATNGVGISATERLRIAANGAITSVSIYDNTVGATNRDVFVDNTGLLGYVSSFRASKKNINPISNTDWLHKLNPVTFNYRVKDSTGKYTDSAYKELEYGLIAEEVEPINKEMVFYDVDSVGNKKLRGVHYSKLIIPLLAEVKEHKKKLDEQQTIIEALLTRIKALEAKLN